MKKGRIEVICGPMFSGKTTRVIDCLERAIIAKQKVQSFKSKLDDRYDKVALYSHKGIKFADTYTIKKSSEILELLEENVDVVSIDEAQFFDSGLIGVCEELAGRGMRIIVAGLDMDSNCIPFGSMPQLLCKAEKITKLSAVCVCCGEDANFTFRKTNEDSTILVGAAEIYEARCRRCYSVGEAQKAIQQDLED